MLIFTQQQWQRLADLYAGALREICARDRHVVVFFEGWNPPWQKSGGKTIPLDHPSTLAQIRRGVISGYSKYQSTYPDRPDLATEAYATDTDDDVKVMAKEFIKAQRKGRGKVIIYGYSWGGDTAIELATDLSDETIHLLITIDAALGIFNGPAVRDREIPANVELNVNHYTTTPNSGAGSTGLPNWAKDPSRTLVENFEHTGPTHGKMDEYTKDDAVTSIVNELTEFGLIAACLPSS